MAVRLLAQPEPLASDTDGYRSLARAIQFVHQVGDAFTEMFGNGVKDGGTLSQSGAFGVSLASGTVLHAGGYPYTLPSNLTYGPLPSGTSNMYVWATMTPTRAPKTQATTLDSVAVALTHTLTSTAPTVTNGAAIPIAIVDTDGAGITDIDNAPTGKYIADVATLETLVNAWKAGGKFVVAEANGNLDAEVNLGALTTGILKHTVTAGVSAPATATPGTDYYNPGGTDVALADGGTGASTAAAARNNLGLGTAAVENTGAFESAGAVATHEADTTNVHGITDTATLYRAGGTDVAVADGGTGASTAAGARTALDVPSNAEAILDTLIDAKGDLIAGTAADTPARVAVGTDGKTLRANSGATPGIDWVDDPYVVSYWTYDLLPASKSITRHTPAVKCKLVASLTGSPIPAPVTNPTSTTTITLKKNGSSIGTIAFNTDGTRTITFASDVTFNGTTDYLEIVTPAQDATLAGVEISLYLVRIP